MQENTINRPDEHPKKNPGKQISGLAHLKHLESKDIDVECHLKPSSIGVSCNFWLGIYKHGCLSPAEVVSLPSVDEALKISSERGISANEPILFSNCETGETSYTLLVPEVAENQTPASWLEEVYSSICSINPNVIGIHFGKTQLDRENLTRTIKLFLQLANKKADGSSMSLFNKVFVMTAGHSFQNILNVMFEIKKDLARSDLKIKIFH